MARKPARKPRVLQDDAIGEALSMIRGANLTFVQVANKSGVSRSCLRNWDKGITMRPQFPTVRAVALACGFDIQFVRIGQNVVQFPVRRRG